jgi:hypothetical protein
VGLKGANLVFVPIASHPKPQGSRGAEVPRSYDLLRTSAPLLLRKDKGVAPKRSEDANARFNSTSVF